MIAVVGEMQSREAWQPIANENSPLLPGIEHVILFSLAPNEDHNSGPLPLLWFPYLMSPVRLAIYLPQ